MFTKKRFGSMSVNRLAAAKGIFRLTKENIRIFEDDPNFSEEEIETIKQLVRTCDKAANDKIINSSLFDESDLETGIIQLCQEFQSNFRWTLNDMQAYISSIVDGQALTPIIFGDIEKLMQSVRDNTAEKVNHQSYKFFKKLLDQGYVLIVIDGNNRTTTIGAFYQDHVPLFESSTYTYQHIDFGNITKNAKHYSLLQSDLRDHIDNTKISVTIVEAGTLEDLGKDFIKVNSQVKLNDQEMRQANVCDFGQKVRDLAQKHESILKKKVTAKVKGKDKIVESALFTEKFIGRRGVEELIVTISNLLTNGTSKVDKSTMDYCYGDKSNALRSNKEFNRVEKIFGKIMKWRDKFGRGFLDSNSALRGNIVDLVWLLDYLEKNDYKIKDEKKFTRWFGETQTLKSNDISKVNPERQVFEFQCSKGDRDDQGNFKFLKYKDGDGGREGNFTGDIRHNTVWMAPDGKPFSYVEIQANLQQNWNELRLEIIKDSLRTVPDDIIIQKDGDRDFPISWRYRKWLEQGGKTFSTGEEIPLIDLYNTKLFHMDHVIEHGQGGLTSYENCHLETSDYNQSGKYKKDSAFEEIDNLFGEDQQVA